MRTAIYPGSFNPWHAGHMDVLTKAIKTFDKVIVAVGFNPDKHDAFAGYPEKTAHDAKMENLKKTINGHFNGLDIVVTSFGGLLKDFIDQHEIHAVVKGLRNGQDFEYEKNQQYWNEDLGVKIPVFYVISDRKFVHISSSAVRAVRRFQK
jgi:pantetheine-phosphate adenylyltransferase